ncbi:NAD(P)-dependent oxidoreductase [Sneathiella marina]|uniref:NAD(P)-dependent oxidoreductase n=1 Tax=Sneathiella marina TaxID=2950108 RepID=A0ABY4W8A3_9PROT|nr:NAD(P)-dependent oxidoreductase [Sneathiella marina]USG63076.1 NAD(P)-dependent oxidoreductase [Sneathiella marina]
MPEPLKIGVAGCGEMGFPMAINLVKNGFDVRGYDIRPKHEFPGIENRMCKSANELASHCSIIISVVRDWQQTQDLCFGTDGLFSDNEGPDILVISSTISPNMVIDLKNRIPATTHLIDAPMSGAPYRAIEGSLTFMVGGDENIIPGLMPVLKAMGSEINHLGPVGAGTTCKVLNNMLAAVSVVTVREVMEAAKSLDFSTQTLLNVAKTSSGSTWFGDNIEKISWANEGYTPDNTIGILEKDVKSLLDATQGHPELRINSFARNVIEELRLLPPIEER